MRRSETAPPSSATGQVRLLVAPKFRSDSYLPLIYS